jgi:hypothetical protein
MLYVRAAGHSKLGFVFLVIELEAMVDIYIDTNVVEIKAEVESNVTSLLDQLCMFWAVFSATHVDTEWLQS